MNVQEPAENWRTPCIGNGDLLPSVVPTMTFRLLNADGRKLPGPVYVVKLPPKLRRNPSFPSPSSPRTEPDSLIATRALMLRPGGANVNETSGLRP